MTPGLITIFNLQPTTDLVRYCNILRLWPRSFPLKAPESLEIRLHSFTRAKPTLHALRKDIRYGTER